MIQLKLVHESRNASTVAIVSVSPALVRMNEWTNVNERTNGERRSADVEPCDTCRSKKTRRLMIQLLRTVTDDIDWLIRLIHSIDWFDWFIQSIRFIRLMNSFDWFIRLIRLIRFIQLLHLRFILRWFIRCRMSAYDYVDACDSLAYVPLPLEISSYHGTMVLVGTVYELVVMTDGLHAAK
jgi:hypothetical protein